MPTQFYVASFLQHWPMKYYLDCNLQIDLKITLIFIISHFARFNCIFSCPLTNTIPPQAFLPEEISLNGNYITNQGRNIAHAFPMWCLLVF